MPPTTRRVIKRKSLSLITDNNESQIIIGNVGSSSSIQNYPNSENTSSQPVRKKRILDNTSTISLNNNSSATAVTASSSRSTHNNNITIPSPFVLPSTTLTISNSVDLSEENHTHTNNENTNNEVIVIEDEGDEFRRHGRNQNDAIVLSDTSDNDEEDEHEEAILDSDDSDDSDDDGNDYIGTEMPEFFFHPQMLPRLALLSSGFGGLLMRALGRMRTTPPEPPRQQADIKKEKYNPPNGTEPVECTICLEKLKKNVIAYKTGCDHMFHVKCLDGWLKSSTRPSCPNCRADLHM